MQANSSLGNKDKLVIAMAAAMGGGCRTCAERLSGMAEAAGAKRDDVAHAFSEGLAARGAATQTMRDKAQALVGGEAWSAAGAGSPHLAPRLAALAQLATATAANSAPDAARFMETAREAGATDAEIRATLGLARTVRSKAQGFSDTELDELQAHTASTPDAGGSASEGAASCPSEERPGDAVCCEDPSPDRRSAPGSCCG